MTVNEGELAADRVQLGILRRKLGEHLATYRRAAGVSQPELSQAMRRTRTTVSKVEHGTRGMPEASWRIADEVCGADGALIAEYQALAEAEQDYRERWRAHQRQARQAAAQPAADSLRAAPVPSLMARNHGHTGEREGRPKISGVEAELAEELMRQLVATLARSLGRRKALQVARWSLGIVGLAGLDADECTRVVLAVTSPHRVDTRVVKNLATTLAYCKRQEDTLGPCEVLDTVIAQQEIVRHLLDGDCPENLRRPLSTVDSDMATTIGNYLRDMGQPDAARRYFDRGRRAAHQAHNPACAAYAAANTSIAAFLRHDTPTAVDTAAAARSLAARTDDARLKAFAELQAAAAYALEGQYGLCMAACERAQEFLTNDNGPAPGSLAYWVHEGTLDSRRSMYLSLLGRPHDAVEAATNALARYEHTPYVHYQAKCAVRLGTALALSEEITEAARVLGDAASFAHLSPRLTAELHAARALMKPWDTTPAVTTLDAQLDAYGLRPSTAPSW
ncbi:MAG: helix-turn-helix domain-containing protein [Pseudonocardiales bacterium]|nr:helix-turn-helix domain-containing protein [Pseudonocardiales bacterium]